MEATQTTQEYAAFNLEWWNVRSGAQVITEALRAADKLRDGVHLYTPEMLAVVPTPDIGEADLWISIPVSSEDDFMDALDAMRTVVRVKSAIFIPAEDAHIAMAPATVMWDWMYSEYMGG